MKTEFFIAKRLLSDRKNSVISGPILNISVIGIVIGIIVMICSVFIITGFKKEIKEKITGFTGHLSISYFDDNSSLETKPINKNKIDINQIRKIDEVKQVIPFGIKAGIIKKDDLIEGIVFKGFESSNDNQFINKRIISGNGLDIEPNKTSNNIIISEKIQRRLNVKLNDNIIVYFIQDPPRARRFKVSGIYETGLEEFDKTYIIGDIKQIRRLNNWGTNDVSGIEILLKRYDDIEIAQDKINSIISYDLTCQSVKEQNPQITDWLELIDMNVYIILFLVILVSGINMISTLLIIVLEKINMIGLLKSIGAEDVSIRKIFIFLSGLIIAKGIVIGNIIAISLCYIQYYYKFIKLSQDTYYISFVPIDFNIYYLLLINVVTILACLIMLIIPSMIIAKILPIKSLRYQ
ncbi:MAG: hypothetical protein A2X12_07130 [Bacteroidetes bacterium GWE2_29_8]|nr:MAG: hypothetical protein A2X12_07130 [Bacteroidetes bacterium GWE2_29_8]OFY21700.1 MAG: hypothetical protein A2X02_04580 [Bacteroidetes bacterium GWF2_29_10]